MVESLPYVDEVIAENCWEQKVDDIIKNEIDIVVMGSDWAESDKFDYLKEYCEVVFLPRTPGISTTEIKQELGIEVDTGDIVFDTDPSKLQAALNQIQIDVSTIEELGSIGTSLKLKK